VPAFFEVSIVCVYQVLLFESATKQYDNMLEEASGEEFGWPPTDAVAWDQRVEADERMRAATSADSTSRKQDPRTAAPCRYVWLSSHEQCSVPFL
jgi:hypothetical protein